MFGRLLRHEGQLLLGDATIWVLIGILSLSIGYATINGAGWVAFQQRAIAEAAAEEQQRFARFEADIVRITRDRVNIAAFADPRRPDVVGRRTGSRYAVMPPGRLAALSIGQSDLLPYYFRMTTDAKETVTGGAEIENPRRLLTGRFDLAFVLIYLYPLLILALSYNLLSGEKEQGTLALALSQPVSLLRLAIAKVTLRFLVFLAVIVTLSTMAWTLARVPLQEPRLALWIGAVAAYGFFWFAVALAVASRGWSSATNAMGLAAVWLAAVVVVPSLLNLVATSLYPVPSRVEMIQAVRSASREANEEGSRLLARYFQDHPDLADGGSEKALNDFNFVRVAVDAEVERRVRPLMDRFERQLEQQQALVSRLRFLSPAILLQDALNDISDTGTLRHRDFLRQVARYHDQWRSYFVRLTFLNAQLADYSQIPRFAYQEPPLVPVVARVLIAFAGIVVPAAMIALIGLQALRRYPVVG
jgi:ABC-2 type transport system permease protein